MSTVVLPFLEQFGVLSVSLRGLRRRHSTASWTYLFRMTKLLSTSFSVGLQSCESQVTQLWEHCKADQQESPEHKSIHISQYIHKSTVMKIQRPSGTVLRLAHGHTR